MEASRNRVSIRTRKRSLTGRFQGFFTPDPQWINPSSSYPCTSTHSRGHGNRCFQAAKAHPEVRFVAIINPNSGPGQTALPDASYVAALRRLSEIPNIGTLGYVHCSWRRPLRRIAGDRQR